MDNQEIKKLWQIKDYCEIKSLYEPCELLYHWLNTKNDPIARYICGKGSRPDEIGSLQELEQQIIYHFSPLPEALPYLKSLAIVVDRGNTTGVMDICPPRIPMYHPPEKSPFQKSALDSFPIVKIWREATSYPYTTKGLKKDERIGRILSSASLNGGLINKQSLAALYFKLADPIEAITDTNLAKANATLTFYELEISSESADIPRLQRWFPDILTEFLILASDDDEIKKGKYKSTGNSRLHKKIFSCIKKYFIRSGIEKKYIPSSLSAYLQNIQHESWEHLPGYLCHFAAGKTISHSIKRHPWKRIFNLMVPLKGDNAPPKDAINNDAPEKGNFAKIKDHTEPEPENIFTNDKIEALKKSLTGTDRTVVKSQLKILKDNAHDTPYAIETILVGWADFMVRKGSRAGNELYLSTIRQYIHKISSRVAGYIGSEDITMLEGQGLEQIYHQIKSDIHSESYQQFISRGLREFHHFLVEEYYIQPINYNEVLNLVSPDRIVDANIISFDEYYAILEELDRQRDELSLFHEDLPEIVRLIFILSFRCGFRRSEVLKLMIDDLHEMDPATLLIRPNYMRLLKTKSSTRQSPIASLLSKNELNELICFLNKRLSQEAHQPFSKFLFAIPDNLNLIAPSVKIFSFIVSAMRKVTGEPNPKFHHLRHSFATWTIFRLMLADLDVGKTILLPFMPITSKYLQQSRDFRKTVFGNQNITKKYLRAVANLLGHSGPESSLPHYIHFSDLLLKLTLDQRLPCNDRKLLAQITPVNRSTSHRWYMQGGMDGLINKFRRNVSDKRLIVNSQITAPCLVKDNFEKYLTSESRFIYKVWQYLTLSSAENADRDLISKRLELPHRKREIIDLAITKMKELQAPSRRGSPYRWFCKSFDKRNLDGTKELDSIRKPSSQTDTVLIDFYTPLVWELFNTHEGLSRAALKCYIFNVWNKRQDVIFRGFKDVDIAKKYLEYLLALGLKKKKIHFLCYDGGQKNAANSKKWSKLLGLSRRNPIRRKPPLFGNNSPAAKEWLRIKPIFNDKADAGNTAFRFLMTMTAICLDFPGKLD